VKHFINRPVFQLALAQALMMSVNTLLITASAIIGYQLAADKSLATAPLALQFLATMLGSIPASFIMQRIGRKGGFLLASLIGLVGSALAIVALSGQSFLLYCLATPLFGLYTAFGNYFRFTATEVAPPRQRDHAISLVMAGGVLAALIGPNLASHSKGLLETDFVGSFIAVALLYALNLLNFLGMKLPRPTNPAVTQHARPLRAVLAQPSYLTALLSATVGYSVMSLLMTATPLAMMQQHGFPDVAFVIQWHVLGMFAPSFFTGKLIQRFGARRIVTSGALAFIACIAINLSGTTVIHYWLALLLLGIGWNFMFIGGTSLLTETYTEAEKAKAQAFNDFVVFTSVTLASLGAGALQHRWGWQQVNLMVLPLIGASLLAVLWLHRDPAAD
jgi:MFS family permease